MKKRIISKAVFALTALALIVSLVCASGITLAAAENSGNTVLVPDSSKPLRLWYDEEAPYGNEDLSWYYKNNNPTGIAYSLNENDGWERWSVPLGNGYFGANVFGRTETERIQITDKTLASVTKIDGINVGGINNFSETYIDFEHPATSVTNYSRSLDLRTAISTVEYDYSGVTYTREYFTSYPDKVLVIYLAASGEGNLNFTLRPTVPYEQEYALKEGDGVSKTGTVVADADAATIILSGNMGYYDVDFEAQYKIIANSGTVTASNKTYTAEGGAYEYLDDGTLTVSGANDAYIVVSLGTNYVLDPSIFTTSNSTPTEKLDDTVVVSDIVSAELESALKYSYEELKANHIADYSALFSRVEFDIGGVVPTVTTDELVNSYPYANNDGYNKYFEELYFQYGRYLLIASSREKSLPSNLQGVWNRYNVAPFGAGMWHNINEQMNYWPAFTTNLAETFEGYVSYYQAYKEAAEDMATYVLKTNSSDYPNFVYSGEQGVYGWCLGTATTPYTISGSRSSGNLGFMMALFNDWYEFTQSTDALMISYDALSGASKFITTLMQPRDDGTYLNPYSDSPEMFVDGVWYYTEGSTYDQTFAYENAKNTLALAKKLEEMGELKVDGVAVTISDVPVLVTLQEQIDKYDAILVGYSGQIKEFREEKYYCDVGDFPNHRHISQLVGLYPANTINSNTSAWLDAARVSLLNRGNEAEGWGWAMAHRIACWARLKDGDNAYEIYQKLLSEKTATNLWCMTNSGFQIDGNFGGTAGIAEMLLQSHEGYIEPLAAIPEAWSSGQYNGLCARGNFTVSAAWTNGNVTTLNITSGSGGVCNIKCDGIAGATVYEVREGGNVEAMSSVSDGVMTFDTTAGKTYIICGFDSVEEVSSPTSATAVMTDADTLSISWSGAANADSYVVYKAVENEPDYTKIAETASTTVNYTLKDNEKNARMTLKVVSATENGSVSDGGAIAYVIPVEMTLTDYEAVIFDGAKLQITLLPEENPEGEYDMFSLYEIDNGVSTLVASSSYGVLIYDGYDSGKEYAVTASIGPVETAAYGIDHFVYARSTESDESNIFLGKLFKETTGAAYYAAYPISMVTDGIDNSNTNRYASNASLTQVIFELDLEGTYFLDTLVITAFQSYDGTTRSLTDVVLQVYKNGEWSDSYSEYTTEIKLGYYNKFTLQLGGLEAEAVRLTLKNTGSGGISIKEITCTDCPYTEAGTQKDIPDVLLGLTPEVIGRADSADHGSYPIKNITDGDTKTRWSSSGAMNNYMNVKFTLGGKYELYDLVVNMFDKKTAVSYVKLHYNGTVTTVYDKNLSENLAGLIDITTKNYDYYFSLNGMKADAIEFYFVAGESVDTSAKQWLSIFDITCSAKTEECLFGITDKTELAQAIDYVGGFNFDAVDSAKREALMALLASGIDSALTMPSDFSAIDILIGELNSACDHSYGITLGDCSLCGIMIIGGDSEIIEVTVGHSCSFQNDISVNYYIPATELDDYTGIYLLVERDKYIDGVITHIEEILSNPVAVGENLKFTYRGIAACEMGDVISATLYAIKDGKSYVSELDEYSIENYAYNRLAASSDEAFKTLLVDMLNYGAAAQLYFGYNTENLVNEALTEEQKALATASVSPESIARVENTVDGATVTFVGQSVVFNNNVELKYYMRFAEGTDISSLTLLLSYTTTTGVEKTIEINGEDFVYVEAYNAYSAKYTEIAAADMSCEIRATVYDGVNAVSNTMVYSIESYVANRLEASSNEMFKTLITEMMKYSASARAYWGEATVTVKYVNESGETISTERLTCKTGTEYKIASPTVAGYYTRDMYVSGTVTKNATVTVEYKKIPDNVDSEKIKEIIPGIVCWGDSLTAGAGSGSVDVANANGIDLVSLGSTASGATYGNTLKNLINNKVVSGVDVANCGVGGESSAVIAARAMTETYYLYLVDTVSVAAGESVVIDIRQYSGEGRLGILRQGHGNSVNSVTISGKDEFGNEITVTGNISLKMRDGATGSIMTCDYSDLVYTFTRTDSGNTATLESGAKIFTYGSYAYDGNWCVIFMGQNGGYVDVAELIEQQKEILAACDCTDNYVIVGLSSGTAAERAEMEAQMKAYWGDHYFSAREELSKESAYVRAGFSEEVIAEYKSDIEAGKISRLFLYDSVHLNAVGYAMLGNTVFEKMVELGYFNAIYNYYDSLK